MRILLDTNVLLWLLYNREDKLTSDVKKIIYDTSNDLFVSVCSLWETEIKHLKKPELMPISGDELYEALTDTDVRLLHIRVLVLQLGQQDWNFNKVTLYLFNH